MKNILVALMSVVLFSSTAMAEEKKDPKIVVSIDDAELLDLRLQAQSLRTTLNVLRRDIQALQKEYKLMIDLRRTLVNSLNREVPSHTVKGNDGKR